MALVLDTNDVKLLVELGFVALSAGLLKEAEVIFTGVKSARPAGEAGPLGLALLRMAQGNLDEAISILKAQRRSVAAKTFLGLALARHGDRKQAQKTLQGVIDRASGTSFAELATVGLHELTGAS